VAVRRDVPLVCVPAGTRNHFALDLGLDRDDVVGALDAFGNAVERRIDLATVGDRVFVNNVSLGVYPKIVQAPEYRDAKRRTTASLLPDLLGPDAPPFDLRFTGPDGAPREGAQIIQVSNNPYVLTRIGGFGSRARLDTGQLGIAAARVDGAAEVAQIVAAEASGRIGRFPGWQEWAAPTFRVESDQPIEAGVDGEALLLEPPLEFRILPGTLRVRIPGHARGRSPAALTAPSPWWTVAALVRATAGRPTPVDPAKR
jgi:diacylglycerol kinase family enzyme